jgi:hypothetical protein
VENLIKTLFAKVLDRFLKKTGLYSMAFSNLPDCSCKMRSWKMIYDQILTDNSYQETVTNDRYFIFQQLKDLSDFKKYSQANKPFWQVTWKGFDPKNYWEIVRGWLWLPAYLGVKSDQERESVFKKILSWLETNPYPNGLAWTVNLDVAIRAMNLLIIYSFCQDKRLKEPLWQHYMYIKKRIWFSKISIRNNHYLGELTTLAILAKLFDQKEQHQYKNDLENEFQNQFYRDGVNVEQSMRYHAFSVQFALLAKIFLGLKLPLLERSLDFVLMMQKPDGSWPSFGDDDMGCVFRLNSDPLKEDYDALLGFYGLLYYDSRAKYVLKELPKEPQLFIEGAKEKWTSLKKEEPPLSKVYPEGGFWTKRTCWGNNANWMMIKFGPHKWHAHADLFHVELSVNGIPVLIDSGTYRYNNVPKERKYFRSTAAHNCLEFEGQDQSKQLTTFRWAQCAKVKKWDIQETEESFNFYGEHNGYSNKGLNCQRKINGNNDLDIINVQDSLEGKEEGQTKVYWHFPKAIDLKSIDPCSFEIQTKEKILGSINIDSNESIECEIIETPYSEHYGHLSKKKTLLISARKKAQKTLTVKSNFTFNIKGAQSLND